MLSIIINILPFPFYSRINPEVEEESDQGVEGDKKKSRRKKKDLEDDDMLPDHNISFVFTSCYFCCVMDLLSETM